MIIVIAIVKRCRDRNFAAIRWLRNINYKHVAAEMRYDGMDKNLFAVMPPMGWNSYDYYDTGVTEEQVKANADYMAKHLKHKLF